MRRLTALPPIHQPHDVPHASFNAPCELFRLKKKINHPFICVKADVYETTTDPFSGAHYIRSTDVHFLTESSLSGQGRGLPRVSDLPGRAEGGCAVGPGLGGWGMAGRTAAPGTGLQGQIGFLKNNLSQPHFPGQVNSCLTGDLFLMLVDSDGTHSLELLAWLRQSTALGCPPHSLSQEVERPRSPHQQKGGSPGTTLRRRQLEPWRIGRRRLAFFSNTNPEAVNAEVSCAFTYRRSPRSKRQGYWFVLCDLFSHLKMYYKNI